MGETTGGLEAVGLFQGFERAELERIARLGHVVQFSRDTVLFREGEPGGGFYVVLGGSVRISKAIPHVGEEAMHFARAGDFFGEMALLDDLPRSATAVAHEDCEIFILKKAAFLDLTYSDPALGCKALWALCRNFSQRLRATTERFATLFVVSRAF